MKGLTLPSRRALDARYPKQLDAAVNAALKPLTAKKQGRAARPEGAKSGEAEGAQRVLDFVRGALDMRSGRMLMPDAPATLSLAVDAPSAELRRLVSACVGTAYGPLTVSSFDMGNHMLAFALGCNLRPSD